MDLSNIKVSVITPTYNSEKFIKETLESIINQTHKNLEVLVVDDCSKDNTIEIVKSFNDSRIKLFQNEKNSGAAYSRNKALSEATGDYIAFLDGDDLWYKDKLEKQLTFMLDNNYVFCYTKYELIDENSNRLGIIYTGPKKVTHRKFLRIDYVGTSTVMYKREIYPDLCIPNDIYKRNDDALWLLLSKKSSCFLFPVLLSRYRKSNNSISSGNKTKLFKYHVLLYKKLYGFSTTKSYFFAFRNVLFYFLKQIRYKSKTNYR